MIDQEIIAGTIREELFTLRADGVGYCGNVVANVKGIEVDLAHHEHYDREQLIFSLNYLFYRDKLLPKIPVNICLFHNGEFKTTLLING